jgi:predicted CoA-binding protein
MASLDQIQGFLASKRIAFAGVSRNPRDFTRMLFREFRGRGYDVVPVNPNLAEVDGVPCFATVAEISPPVEAALLLTPPAMNSRLAEDCVQAGIRKIWIYRRAAEPAPEGLNLISGECPFMFLPQTGGIHRFHGFCRKLVGSFPK